MDKRRYIAKAKTIAAPSGERALGLPKEPGFDRDTPFNELPKNQ